MFDGDMHIIQEVVRAEAKMYRTAVMDATDKMRRANGLGYNTGSGEEEEEEGGVVVVHWRRGTSVHPHMMLGWQ